MDSIDAYSRYYEAEMTVNDYPRRGALVKLTVTSAEGRVKYEASASFMFYEDPEDFRVPGDVYYSETLYDEPGIRSKKREAEFVAKLPKVIDRLIEKDGGRVFWDKPITDPRFG